MKKIFLSFLLTVLLSIQSLAVTFLVTGKNSESLLKTQVTTALPKNLGEISISVFDDLHIPYKGGTYGLTELFGLGQTTEIISDTEMKAYGWCFSINKLTPDTMSDQTMVNENSDVIHWYYAYAHYKDGLWIGQCVK